MILKIKNRKYDFFESVQVALKYDSVASAFACDAFFNPDNVTHKELFRPLQFAKVELEHEGELLLTGTLLNNKFNSSAVEQLTPISGYSLPGVFENCEIPVELYPLQSDGISLKDIASRICKKFGIALVVDPAVAAKVSANYDTSTASHQQTIKAYLAELASQKNVVLSHTAAGALLLTEAKTKSTPIFHFERGVVGVTSMVLDVSGESVHSRIDVIGQASVDDDNARQSSVTNPYGAAAYRPKVVTQTAGNSNDTQHGARNYLSEELKAIKLTIELDRWALNGKIVRPNQLVTVLDKSQHLYKKTTFFIDSVDLKADKLGKTATLHCVLPEVYNNATPKNIFA